jgi:hypothetical protein
MLPETKATYSARAIGCYFGRAGENGSGNAQVFVPFRISFADGDEHITWSGTLPTDGGKAFQITIKALRTLGWQGDDLADLDDLDEEGAAKLLPNQVDIVCDMDDYNGESRLKVKWVNPPGGVRMAKHALAGSDLKTFAAQMRGTIRSMGTPTEVRSSRPPATTMRRPDPHPNAPGGARDRDLNGAKGPDDDTPF